MTLNDLTTGFIYQLNGKFDSWHIATTPKQPQVSYHA